MEIATDNIKKLRLKPGQTVADLTKDFGNLVDVRDDCGDDHLTSEHKGFYLMEIMRKTVEEGGLVRGFSTAPQSLDINQDQRKKYEGIVKIFKAADEPQTTALAQELSKAGSSRQNPEEMHALNVETRRECSRCNKFGKDECWTHSTIKCAVCKKRGKTCPCVKKQAQQAEATK